jgi:Uncharacterized protein conserved in bacteria
MAIFNKPKDYTLVDAVKESTNNPRTFLIPTDAEISALSERSTVKLIFLLKKTPKDGSRAERMWVKISDIKGNTYTGTLTNTPCYLKSLSPGDTVSFCVQNIASIHGQKSSIDDNMLAIITRKALGMRQINWVTRADEKHDSKDSGWQFFYGDETPEYLSEPKNSTIARLVDVLSFEPLLEQVLGESGTSYEYDEKQNRFIEVAQ